jgi:hypothetical protein
MELTGKCKEDFKKWFKGRFKYMSFFEFEYLQCSMQYGVYVDFFDSVKLFINVNTVTNYVCHVFIKENFDYIKNINRTEARAEAIKKANEIYNK